MQPDSLLSPCKMAVMHASYNLPRPLHHIMQWKCSKSPSTECPKFLQILILQEDAWPLGSTMPAYGRVRIYMPLPQHVLCFLGMPKLLAGASSSDWPLMSMSVA